MYIRNQSNSNNKLATELNEENLKDSNEIDYWKNMT